MQAKTMLRKEIVFGRKPIPASARAVAAAHRVSRARMGRRLISSAVSLTGRSRCVTAVVLRCKPYPEPGWDWERDSKISFNLW